MTVETLKQYTQELAKKITFNTENLYQHNLTLRLNDAYRKVAVNIITTDNINYTNAVSRFTEYLKKFHSASNSEATGNIQNCLLCDGYYRDNNNYWYYPKFLYYSTTDNTLRVLGLRDNTETAPNNFTILSEFGSSYTIITDNVTTIALNNVNKPSVYTVNTNISYNGSTIGTLNWTLLKYPVDATKYKYEWIGKATCSSVNIPITGISGNLYESTAPIIIGQPSMMTNFQKNQLRIGMYSQSSWGFMVYPIGNPLYSYLLASGQKTVNGALDITIYGSTVE